MVDSLNVVGVAGASLLPPPPPPHPDRIKVLVHNIAANNFNINCLEFINYSP